MRLKTTLTVPTSSDLYDMAVENETLAENNITDTVWESWCSVIDSGRGRGRWRGSHRYIGSFILRYFHAGIFQDVSP